MLTSFIAIHKYNWFYTEEVSYTLSFSNLLIAGPLNKIMIIKILKIRMYIKRFIITLVIYVCTLLKPSIFSFIHFFTIPNLIWSWSSNTLLVGFPFNVLVLASFITCNQYRNYLFFPYPFCNTQRDQLFSNRNIRVYALNGFHSLLIRMIILCSMVQLNSFHTCFWRSKEYLPFMRNILNTLSKVLRYFYIKCKHYLSLK